MNKAALFGLMPLAGDGTSKLPTGFRI